MLNVRFSHGVARNMPAPRPVARTDFGTAFSGKSFCRTICGARAHHELLHGVNGWESKLIGDCNEGPVTFQLDRQVKHSRRDYLSVQQTRTHSA